MGKEKILFFYLRTGGGHLAPAKAISQYISTHCADHVETILVDGLEKSNCLVRFLLEDGYRILQAKARWGYELLYAANKIHAVRHSNLSVVSSFLRRSIRHVIQKEQPTKIVILHFFLIEPVYKAIRDEKITIPVLTLVTDPFTAHPMWFERQEQQFLIFSDRLKCHCLELGIAEERLSLFPFPVSAHFSSPMTESERLHARQKLGFADKNKMILILGGSDGIPRGLKIVRTLLSHLPAVEIAIVCGNNRALFRKAELIRLRTGDQRLKVYGFIPFVYDLINLADAVITKCGASTSAEILLMKKIPIITDYLWEQEKGNMEFIHYDKLGIYEPRLDKLPALLDRLLRDSHYHESFLTNIEKAGLINGTPKIAEWLTRR